MEIDDLDRAAAEIPEARGARRLMLTFFFMALGGVILMIAGVLFSPLVALFPLGIVTSLVGLVGLPFAATRVARKTGQTRWRALGTGLRVTCKTVREVVCSLP